MVRLSITIAIYAAIVGSLALGWDIYKYSRDKPRLIVTSYEGLVVKTDKDKSPLLLDLQDFKGLVARNDVQVLVSNEVIFLKAVNDSTRPITITYWGVGYKEGGSFHFSPPQELSAPPYKLEEGQALTLWVSKQGMIKKIQDDNKTPEFCFFKTADDRICKSSGFAINGRGDDLN